MKLPGALRAKSLPVDAKRTCLRQAGIPFAGPHKPLASMCLLGARHKLSGG